MEYDKDKVHDTISEPYNWGFNYPWEIIRTLFSLWDRSGGDPNLLVALWGLFEYDLAFLEDMTLCYQLLDFQRKRRDIEEIFGI